MENLSQLLTSHLNMILLATTNNKDLNYSFLIYIQFLLTLVSLLGTFSDKYSLYVAPSLSSVS